MMIPFRLLGAYHEDTMTDLQSIAFTQHQEFSSRDRRRDAKVRIAQLNNKSRQVIQEKGRSLPFISKNPFISIGHRKSEFMI